MLVVVHNVVALTSKEKMELAMCIQIINDAFMPYMWKKKYPIHWIGVPALVLYSKGEIPSSIGLEHL